MIEAGPPRDIQQPVEFAFTDENMKRAQAAIAKYPVGRQQSAIMPLLHIAQEQQGWLPTVAIAYCAELLGMPAIKAFEVASFYTMYHRRPVGQHHLQVCTSISCCLRGSDDILAACAKKLNIDTHGEVSADGLFSIEEVECIGACVNAPAVQINNDVVEDLTVEGMENILDRLARGEKVGAGSQIGRHGSCGASGPTTLKGES